MKNIRIKIKDNGSIHVSANTSVSLSVIEKFMLEKIDWILAHQDTSPPRDYDFCEGVRLRIFGVVYNLQIQKADSDSFAVDDDHNLVIFCTESENSAAVQRIVSSFIVEIGRNMLTRLLKGYLDTLAAGDLALPRQPLPNLSLKLLQSKWGHCSRKSAPPEIMINLAVCGLPLELIQYIVAHEAVHLYVPNHQAQFYGLGERLMPGFRAFDRQLNKFSPDLWANVFVE